MQVNIGYALVEIDEFANLVVLLNHNDYIFDNNFIPLLNDLLDSLSSKRIILSQANLMLIADQIKLSFQAMESSGFIRPNTNVRKLNVCVDSVDYEAQQKEKYDRAKSMWYRRLKEEFEIDNSDDIHYIFNKLNNQYSKYKGDIDSVRVCYSDGKGKLDKLYRYIKHHQCKDGYYDQVFYNVVTGNYIAVGFGFSEK